MSPMIGSNISSRGRGVSFLSQRFGPVAENLQLLLDYEDWNAGEPLPNVYPDNSGITELQDNNSVQEETSSPLVGSKSGRYDDSNNKHHSAPNNSSLQIGGETDIYIACWLRFDTLPSTKGNQKAQLSHLDFSNDKGYLLYINASDEVRFGIGGRFSGKNPVSIPDTNEHFLEAFYLSSTLEIFARLDNNSRQLQTIRSSQPGAANVDLTVGAYNEGVDRFMDGALDQIMVEVAPQGELFWPDHSSWLYNSGNGRSSYEILNYNP